MSEWKRNRLRMIRAEKRLTQHAVAQRMGVSQATYWQLETAVREPDAETRARIARALRVNVGDLLEKAS